MTQINSMGFFWGHCHKKRRQIKPEQPGKLTRRYSDRQYPSTPFSCCNRSFIAFCRS